jgi:hypothetical protein
MNSSAIRRPQTLREVAEQSGSLSEFGMNLRDWQHEVRRGGVYSRKELSRRVSETPAILSGQFPGGNTADAYLAAYAEWLADRASIDRPAWCRDSRRVAREPWFATPIRGWLLAATPASFRQRNLFTIPEPVFHPRPGRPRVSEARKREKARLRQKAYRARVRNLLEKARAAGITG